MRILKTIVLGLSVAALPASVAFAAEKKAEQQTKVETGAPAGQQGALGLSQTATGLIGIAGVIGVGVAVGASNNDEGATGTTP